MQDTDVDIAMFAVYALYEKDEVDDLITLIIQKAARKQNE